MRRRSRSASSVSQMSPPSSRPDVPAPGEGDRAAGAVAAGYDADRVAAAARQADPSLPEGTARELAVYAWDHLRQVGELDAPEVARRLFADHPDAGATSASQVARAAVDHCQAQGLAPG